jgi:hypothetical protein
MRVTSAPTAFKLHFGVRQSLHVLTKWQSTSCFESLQVQLVCMDDVMVSVHQIVTWHRQTVYGTFNKLWRKWTRMYAKNIDRTHKPQSTVDWTTRARNEQTMRTDNSATRWINIDRTSDGLPVFHVGLSQPLANYARRILQLKSNNNNNNDTARFFYRSMDLSVWWHTGDQSNTAVY